MEDWVSRFGVACVVGALLTGASGRASAQDDAPPQQLGATPALAPAAPQSPQAPSAPQAPGAPPSAAPQAPPDYPPPSASPNDDSLAPPSAAGPCRISSTTRTAAPQEQEPTVSRGQRHQQPASSRPHHWKSKRRRRRLRTTCGRRVIGIGTARSTPGSAGTGCRRRTATTTPVRTGTRAARFGISPQVVGRSRSAVRSCIRSTRAGTVGSARTAGRTSACT